MVAPIAGRSLSPRLKSVVGQRHGPDALPVEDVQGIGPAPDVKLASLGTSMAAHLRDLSPEQARALGTVALERTVLELGGLSCLALEEAPPQRKGMAAARSFGRPVTSLDELREAVAAHATRAGGFCQGSLRIGVERGPG